MVAGHREDAARAGDRDADEHRQHVEDHHELEQTRNRDSAVAARLGRSRQPEERGAGVLADLVEAEVVAGHLRVGHEQVERRHEYDGEEDRARDVALGVLGLLAEVGGGLEAGEEQDAVDDAEEDARPPVG